MPEPDPPVDRCPWCEEEGRDVRGKIDYRIKVGGRYVYHCPAQREHSWQDIRETPSEKGFVRLARPGGNDDLSLSSTGRREAFPHTTTAHDDGKTA